MKTVNLIAAIVSSSLGLSACSTFRYAGIHIGNTPARTVAMDSSLPGKGVHGQCLPYALALQSKFMAQGIDSRIIAYRSEDLTDSRDYGRSRKHAVVSYSDEGRTYLMDNLSDEPLWVESSLPTEQKLGQLEGMDARVLRAWDIAPRTYSRVHRLGVEHRMLR